jgi:hypothetical protein
VNARPECPATKIYKGNIVYLTLSTAPALLLNSNGGIEEECHGKLLALGTTIENEGSHKGVKILIDAGAQEVSSCSGLCEESESPRPSWRLVEALTLEAWLSGDNGGNWLWRLFHCIFGINCYYEFTNASQSSAVSGDAVVSTKVPLTRVSPSSSLCPTGTTFDTTYLVTKDEVGGAPIYVAALP